MELPLALPVIMAGLRVATVSTVALTTVGALVAHGGLGNLIRDGVYSNFRAELLAACLLCVVLAVLLDLVLVGAQRLLTPWTRAGGRPVNVLGDAWSYLLDPAHWSGPDGMLALLAQQLLISVTALAVAVLLGLPVALWLGHLGRGGFLAINVSERRARRAHVRAARPAGDRGLARHRQPGAVRPRRPGDADRPRRRSRCPRSSPTPTSRARGARGRARSRRAGWG